jgi:hypothetical protein
MLDLGNGIYSQRGDGTMVGVLLVPLNDGYPAYPPYVALGAVFESHLECRVYAHWTVGTYCRS